MLSSPLAPAQVQANQLGDLVVELLEPARFQQLSASTQLAALHALPGLLAALPDSQAVSTLRALCALCPDLSSAGAGGADSAAASWVEALLQGLHGIAAGGPTAAEAQSSSPALQLALQQQLVVTVLPRLPPPSLLPVALAGSAVAAGAAGVEEGAGASGPQCWEAAIACFAALPATKVSRGTCAIATWGCADLGIGIRIGFEVSRRNFIPLSPLSTSSLCRHPPAA